MRYYGASYYITNQSYQMRRSWLCRYIPTHEYVYICTIEDGARCVLVPV